MRAHVRVGVRQGPPDAPGYLNISLDAIELPDQFERGEIVKRIDVSDLPPLTPDQGIEVVVNFGDEPTDWPRVFTGDEDVPSEEEIARELRDLSNMERMTRYAKQRAEAQRGAFERAVRWLLDEHGDKFERDEEAEGIVRVMFSRAGYPAEIESLIERAEGEARIDIGRMGPLLDQAHSCLAKLAYASGAVAACPESAQRLTVHESMRDLTHTLAHMEEVLGYG